MTNSAIYLIGEAMLEFAPAGEDALYRLGVAGDSFNTAVAISQLGSACEYISAVGDDAASECLLAALDHWDVGRLGVRRLPGATPGLYLITLDDRGERSFSYWREHSAAAQFFHRPGDVESVLAGLAPGRWLYLSGISLAIAGAEVRQLLGAFVDRYRASGGRLAFDCNHRERLWPDRAAAAETYKAWFARSDLLLPGVEDLQSALGLDEARAVPYLQSTGVATVVLKRGADGPLVLEDGSVTPITGERVVAPLDTTGAGDAFNGALIAALLQGEEAVAASAFAHRVAAAVVQQPGALPSAETWVSFRQSFAKNK